MAIDFNGALTLADHAALSNDPLVKEITKSLHQTWNALKDIPLFTSPSLKQVGMRYLNQNIPLPNWTGVNSEPVAVKGKPKSYEESLYLVRNKILVDHVLLDQPTNIIDPIEAQVQIFLEGFAYDFNDKFVNNNPASPAPGNSADCFPDLHTAWTTSLITTFLLKWTWLLRVVPQTSIRTPRQLLTTSFSRCKNFLTI